MALYGSADIFVFPSIFEAFPIPPIEAMASGLPVVATRVGGTAESVVDGETGLLLDRNDAVGLVHAIRVLVEDPERRRSLGEAGRRRASALFSWTSVAHGLVEILSDSPSRTPAAEAPA
jgi:glycosyltransferase involved in cell wall biosynthesis